MSDEVRDLGLREPHQLTRQRSSRAGRDGRPRPGDPGLIGDDYKLHDQKQDRKFQDAMLLAMSRRQEKLPPVVVHAHDSVPMRRHVPGQVLTASNLEN